MRVVAAGRAELRAYVNEHLFHPPHVRDDIHRIGQLHDRVADDLTGTVPGDPATAVDVDDGGAVDGAVARRVVRLPAVKTLRCLEQHRVAPVAVGDLARAAGAVRPRRSW